MDLALGGNEPSKAKHGELSVAASERIEGDYAERGTVADLEEGVVKLKAPLNDGKSRVARPYDVDITEY
jgi:hypothetical protein